MKKFFSGINAKTLLIIAGFIAAFFLLKKVLKLFGGKASEQDKAQFEDWIQNEPKTWNGLSKSTSALDNICLQIETELMSILPSGNDIADLLTGLTQGDLTYIYWKYGQKPHTVFGLNRIMLDMFGWIKKECFWGLSAIEKIYNFEPLKFINE